eukprot:697835-Pelagomonas_calceolata.AAC.1
MGCQDAVLAASLSQPDTDITDWRSTIGPSSLFNSKSVISQPESSNVGKDMTGKIQIYVFRQSIRRVKLGKDALSVTGPANTQKDGVNNKAAAAAVAAAVAAVASVAIAAARCLLQGIMPPTAAGLQSKRSCQNEGEQLPAGITALSKAGSKSGTRVTLTRVETKEEWKAEPADGRELMAGREAP